VPEIADEPVFQNNLNGMRNHDMVSMKSLAPGHFNVAFCLLEQKAPIYQKSFRRYPGKSGSSSL
jgi:hypothetical protein